MKKVHNIGFMKLVSVLTVLIMMFSAFGIGVMASEINYGNAISINGSVLDMNPIHLGNERYLNTDS